MWAELSLPWQTCLDEAWAAYGAGSVPIGAVVTDAEGRVLARGRNHIGDGGPGAVCGHELAHAELNALLATDVRPRERSTWVLYTTCEPCPLCFGAFYMSGLRTLRYAARDPWAGSANLRGTTPYLSRKPIRVYGPERADLEALLVALHTEHTLRERGESARDLLDVWAAVMPAGVALGEAVFGEGTLPALCGAGASARAVVEALSARLAESAHPPAD